MADAGFMPQGNDSFRFKQHEPMQLWMRGSLLVGVVGLLMLMVLSTQLCLSHRACPPDTTPQRINPNTASMASLVRLPGIGKARAMDMIAYRDHQPNGPVFQSPQDLEQIRGIGPKTAEKLAPWLVFNAEDTTVASDANGDEIKK